MKNKFLTYLLILISILIFVSPVSAETLNWEAVNYSDPDLIAESGLTVDEFNSLSQSDWLDLFDDKKKVNFAFQAIDSTGKDITNSVNPNLSINVAGLSGNELVKFENIEQEQINEFIDKYALSFDGENDYVEVLNQNNLNIENQITYEFWLKANSYQTNTDPFVMSKGYEVLEAHIQSDLGENRIRFIPTKNIYLDTPNSSFDYDVWTHWAISYDVTNKEINIYKNGLNIEYSKMGSGVIGDPIIIDNSNLYFGKRIKDYTDETYTKLNGMVNEIRIWNRILAQSEIQNNMNKSLTGNEEGLVAYYDMEEGSGSILLDKTGNNDGTIYGAEYILK
jgi:hypothetical protein